MKKNRYLKPTLSECELVVEHGLAASGRTVIIAPDTNPEDWNGGNLDWL